MLGVLQIGSATWLTEADVQRHPGRRDMCVGPVENLPVLLVLVEAAIQQRTNEATALRDAEYLRVGDSAAQRISGARVMMKIRYEITRRRKS